MWGGEGKALYFCRGGGGGLFFFQFSGQLAFVKMFNFLQVMVLLKKAVCSNGEKKVPIFRRGLSRKNELCENHDGGVD